MPTGREPDSESFPFRLIGCELKHRYADRLKGQSHSLVSVATFSDRVRKFEYNAFPFPAIENLPDYCRPDKEIVE